MVPAFAYKYWKCYYAAGSPSFKAAELYSTDVDYYTFGSCRLVDGSYYCGLFSTFAPYKGLASTPDSVHIGSDDRSSPTSSVNKESTGTMVWSPNNPNEAKLQKPKNAAYYTPQNAGAQGPQFATNPINNGMWTEMPKAAGTAPQYDTHGVGTFNVGVAASDTKYSWESSKSNYAMNTPTKTKEVYNTGPHYVPEGGIAGPKDNYASYFTN